MASSQMSAKIVDAPQSIQDRASVDSRLVINLRADRWPSELVEECRKDKLWQWRVALYNGLLMFPGFTRFLVHVSPGAKLLISCQESRGDIVTVVGELDYIYWLGEPGDAGQNGVHTNILLKTNHRHGARGYVWAGFILAIVQIRNTARSTSKIDPEGAYFLQTFDRFKIVQTI